MEVFLQLLDEIEDSAVVVALAAAKSRYLFLNLAWLAAAAAGVALILL